MTTTVVSAVSTVFFPYLNRKSKNKAIQEYNNNVSIILLMIYFVILIYYPVHVFIYLYLPDYTSSLSFFRILLPGVEISSCISLVIFNYYKILNESKKYLLFGIFILAFSIFLNWLFYILFHSPMAVAIASLIELLCE